MKICWVNLGSFEGDRNAMVFINDARAYLNKYTGVHFIGLSERGGVNWTEQIRQRCGEELLRREMFPPRKYFSSEMMAWRSSAAD